jgi:hypothetical protein
MMFNSTCALEHLRTSGNRKMLARVIKHNQLIEKLTAQDIDLWSCGAAVNRQFMFKESSYFNLLAHR